MYDMDFFFPKDTIMPLEGMTRFTQYYHAKVSSPEYCSEGRYRRNEKHCIFHYTLKGSGECFIGEKRWRTSPGRGFLNIINDSRAGYRYPAGETEPWEFICLCFEGGSARTLVKAMIDRFGPVYELDKTDIPVPLTDEAFWKGDVLFTNALSAELFSALISRLIKSAERGETLVIPPVITAFRKLFFENMSQNLNVSELAYKLGVSREHLSRVFKEYTGWHIKEYMQRQRIIYICRMLKDTDLSIAKISEQSGFSSPSNFTRAFKEFTGMTPAQFRRHGVIPIL